MSLSTPALAGLGAVVVIAAGTLGGSYAVASDKETPLSARATITIGRSSHQLETPSCYNGGAPLTQDLLTKCGLKQKDITQQTSLTIHSSDRIGVGVDPDTGKHGWKAATNGGNGQTGASLAVFQKDNTFSGLQPASNVLTQTRNTTLTVIGYDPKTADSAQPGILAVWFVNLQNNAAPAASAQAQDPTQGQGQGQAQDPTQGQ